METCDQCFYFGTDLLKFENFQTESEKNVHIPFSLPRFEPEEMKKRARDFYELVNKRRSCRFFSPDPVPRDVLEQCILAAGTSPSGAHTGNFLLRS